MRILFLLFLLITLFLGYFKNTVLAGSDYVLPYPSAMPGSKFYKINIVWEKISKYWYFGSLGQFAYNLRESDKYLVEAKNLFEYKQYLLAIKALKQSDNYFRNIKQNLSSAKLEGKEIGDKEKIYISASIKHQEILMTIEDNTPSTFLWEPEKVKSTLLDLKKTIDNSIQIRKQSI